MPEEHFMLPAQERCWDILELVEQKQYFVIHASRQSGKTTLLKELTGQLSSDGDYKVLYCSLESLQKIPDVERGIPAIMRTLAAQIKFNPQFKGVPFAEGLDYADFNTLIRESLTTFCMDLDKPLVIFFDEIDCLSNGSLSTFLRQLREGYVNRPEIPFVRSVGLVGMRNIRDYKAKIREESDTLGSASPFNIVSESFTLRNFTPDEIQRLYAQYTEQGGQQFPVEVIEAVYAATQGQP